MLLCEKIKLEPTFIHKYYKDEVLRRLKIKVEGICSKHGYIKLNSIEIHKICAGRIELISLNGNTEFDVWFYADVCNPMIGNIIKCQVSNINKFGILAEAENVIETIIAKNSVNIQSDVDLDKIRIDDEVFVEIVGKKYELNEKKISLIGKVVKDLNLKTKNVSTKTVIDGDDVDEIDGDDVDIEGGALNNDIEEDVEETEEVSEKGEDEEEVEEEVEEEDEVFSEGGSEDKSIKFNGNFFSDDEEYFNSDIGSVDGDQNDEEHSFTDDE
jgi:DNA-directed RNA polymerase subunit E'/Rpb7